MIGLVPYSSTPTVEIIITLSIALTLLIAVVVVGFLNNATVLLAAFIPADRYSPGPLNRGSVKIQPYHGGLDLQLLIGWWPPAVLQ